MPAWAFFPLTRPTPGVFVSAEGFYKLLYNLFVRTDAMETVGGLTRQ